MNVNEVIKYPILSEKTYMQMEKQVYTFAVDFRTNKAEVKKVVEFIFDVKVEKVNISTVQKKPKKLGRFEGFTNRYKKAVVTLKDGQIYIFPDETTEKEETKPKAKAVKKETNKEISAAEQKAADKIAAKLAEKEAKSKKEADKPKKEADKPKKESQAEEKADTKK